ncbi:DUF7344 domain-containing protein [Halosimplex amylolyticum]|uniref:DUF7344 domain-containing protein n=1 Tax=Halosimplex amylolyticum TaxID=3396616 RepID=UPI003F557141
MNRQPGAPASGGGGRELATVLGDLRQRRIISILLDRPRPISVRELGIHLSAYDDGVQPSNLSDSAVQSAVTDLEHRCLPRLEAVGMIERDQTGVVAAEPLPIETTLSLPPLHDPEDPDWEPISVLIGRPVRQAVISILSGKDQRLTVDGLTTELRTQSLSDRVASLDDAQYIQTRLHHVALPKLATVDLLTYNPAEQTVARTDRTMHIACQTGLDRTADDVAPS